MTIVLVDGGEVEAGLGWSALTHFPGTAPSAPQTLAAANGAVDPTDIVVTWSEPTDKGGWSTIEGYEVELTSGGNLSTVQAASSPVTFAAKPYGKTYDIRVRAQNRVGWGVWATLQHLHADPIPALPTTNLFARWVAQDLALAEGATVASGAWLDRVSGLALSSTGSDSIYHASGGPGSKPYVSIPKAGKLYRTGMFTGWSKVDIWMVFQDPTNDSYYFLSVAPTGQYSPSATDSQYHGQGAQGASIYNGSMVNNLTQSIRSWIRARFFFSGTTSQVRLKDNVVNGGSNVTTHGDLSLGGHNSGSSEWNNLDLCEIVIYSGTGTTDPEGVMAHFKAKYGLT